MSKEIKKIVLAYSGGLDTSIIVPWLKDNYPGCEVIAVSGNVGQADELEGLEEKAIKTGASKLYIEDLRKEYVEEYIWPCLKADAKYEDYLLGTSHARPCIAKRLVEIALAEGADAICHGCTGKGNDQVRFELTIKAFAPEMAPDKPTYITIHFENGVPTALDGVEMDGVTLIEKLNRIGGANGIGILDIVENRLVGMKSRGVY
ncbi:MAG: argininosuccinate synthase, partial [Clostridia bacterium]|nr:argininosuccinate synthase [Clostridia bacterium]